MSPRNRVAELYPQALASYDLQGGGIRTGLHTGDSAVWMDALAIEPQIGPTRKHFFQQFLIVA
jgi:hypothetical protein